MAVAREPLGQDWARYWRVDGVPVEAMHAHFTAHVYHRHSHESYSFGLTETGAQAFTCRRGRHVSGAGMVMTFNPDDPHDGHAAGEGGFTYRMVHIWPEFFASLIELRVRTARRLLIQGATPARAAVEAGFADQAHLTRWFHRYYGITPGAYRAAGPDRQSRVRR